MYFYRELQVINPKTSEFNFEWQAHDEDDGGI